MNRQTNFRSVLFLWRENMKLVPFEVLEGVNGEKQSMVQRVWGQLKDAGLTESSSISTSKMQRRYNKLEWMFP